MWDMGMLMNVIKGKKVISLGMAYQLSVVVRVVDVPGRRLGIEVTTQDYVGNFCDVLYLWSVIFRDCR